MLLLDIGADDMEDGIEVPGGIELPGDIDVPGGIEVPGGMVVGSKDMVAFGVIALERLTFASWVEFGGN